MSRPRKIEELEALARTMVGDSKTPDLFFVTDQGVVVTVTRHFDTAYQHWCGLAARSPRVECALENRNYGTICSVEPDSDEPDANLVRHDDSQEFASRMTL